MVTKQVETHVAMFNVNKIYSLTKVVFVCVHVLFGNRVYR
jgi:hypothetical protein